MSLDLIIPSLPFIMAGVYVTLKFTIVSILCGLPLAVLLAIASTSHLIITPHSYRTRFFRNLSNIFLIFLKKSAQGYVSIFRGTPLLVQLGIFYFGLPHLIGYNTSAFEAGVLAFALNSAAYSCEVIRSGIQSIDIGQWEASKVLGLNKYRMLQKVILPQAFRNILPALVNELVNILKESALVSTIGEMDLLRRAQMVASEKFLYFEPLLIVALTYYILVLIMNTFAQRLEKSLSYA